MPLNVTADPVPLRKGDDGVIRVGGTRVTLDTLVQAFQEGASPETIADQYPVLDLATVYGAIAFYLHHQNGVHDYLAHRQATANRVRAENERRTPPTGIRQRLLARQQVKG